MEHVFPGAGSLQRTNKVGDGECVALVRAHTSAGWTGRWRPGARVRHNSSIRPGTAIATCEHGRWPSRPDRQHAAFYLRPDPEGFWDIDQYKSRKWVESRLITVKTAKDRAHPAYTPSNDAAAFFVIITP